MANFEEKQFVTDINQYDVLTGRGSGPYEQPGNIHFREIVATRKIEYLSLNPRDSKMKNQIAKEIIDKVRSKGGRFLRKIQVTNKDDGDLYEFVDEDTVMEKAKQALRQNRSGFIKNVMEQSNKDESSSSSAAALTDSLRAEAKAKAVAASSSAIRKAPTKPTPMPTPALSSSPINFFGLDNTKPAATTTSTSGGGGGGIDDDDDFNVGTLDFTGITGPPADPTTPEEWEAFHAYWSDGNEPNRRLWDQLQAQQQRLRQQQQDLQQHLQQVNHQQQQQQHHQQVYQIPENSASSSHYYPISEQGLWDQITQQQQQQRQQLPVTPVANNMSSMVNSSTAPALPFPKHGLVDITPNGPCRVSIQNNPPASAATAFAANGPNAAGIGGVGGGRGAPNTNQDRVQNQQELLNYLFQQQNLQQNFAGSASNHSQVHQPVYQQQPTAGAAAAVPPPADTRTTDSHNQNDMAVMNAYMAHLEQQMMSENKGDGTFGHDLSDSTGRLFRAFEEADSQYRSRTNVTTVSTKGVEQSNSFSKSASEAVTAKRQIRRERSVGSRGSESPGSDYDSFFSGIKDMSLPSMSIGEVSDFGKQSVANKSGTGGSIDILKEVMESAAERAVGVEERFQEVVATVPSQRPTPAAPSINPTPAKRRAKGNKRRSLSSYYREVNAAVAASNGKQSVGEFDTSEANDNGSDRIDAMSCSLQSMSISEDFPSMRQGS
jgi:hypothetical protein